MEVVVRVDKLHGADVRQPNGAAAHAHAGCTEDAEPQNSMHGGQSAHDEECGTNRDDGNHHSHSGRVGQLVLAQRAVEPALGELHAPQGHKREFWGLRNLR